MSLLEVHSFVAGRRVAPGEDARVIADAATGASYARAGGAALDPGEVIEYAVQKGGPSLRAMTFHQRARMLKALALYLHEKRSALYDLSFATGATRSDAVIDIDGGIGTMRVIAAKGRREMPDSHIFLDGATEALSRNGTFVGQHICTPLHGVAVHINAFNFPVWGMLEKLAPTLLAGMPAIVKPATASSYVAELAARFMLESGILPEGSLQFIAGGTGDLLDHLGSQDAIAFTGSAQTALTLRQTPALLRQSVRFSSEQDSLNASVLAPDVKANSPEWDLFIREVRQEMTAKAGQKCTAIRRILVPQTLADSLVNALSEKLGRIIVGDPRSTETQMGALISQAHRNDVLSCCAKIGREAERVCGDPDHFGLDDKALDRGAFLPPILFFCADPDAAQHVHETEAFGPVATLMPFRDADHAAALVNRGGGSLVTSVITGDPDFARHMVMSSASHNGRLYFNNRASMDEATGHGSPLPHMVHGGPGRAGGSEELGGIRSVMHYMQRTAVQGDPDLLSAISNRWLSGAAENPSPAHPFRRGFDELRIGDTLVSASRTITSDDIAHFAEFTGDCFYAHMDDEAARRNPFFPGRVAHGYLLLSFAAGLFVDPEEGPVLANTGLDRLRFLQPVVPGDSISVHLTVRQKTSRTAEYGEVRWRVLIINQRDEAVAEYELLTMNRT